MIDFSTGEFSILPETGNGILIYSYGKIWMQYFVSDTDPYVGDGTIVTMGINLTASGTSGFVTRGFPDKSEGMVGSQAVVGIPQYNMLVKYGLKGYADQAELTGKHQTIMDASVETLDGEILLKFKKLLVEEGENEIIVNDHQKFIYGFSDTVCEGYG